jgi:hypothetical protein
MAQAQAEIEPEIVALAQRIQALPEAEKVKILARVMAAEGTKVGWDAIERLQRAMPPVADQAELDRLIVEEVRAVRRERRNGRDK